MRRGAVIILVLLVLGLAVWFLRRATPEANAVKNPPDVLATNVSVTAVERGAAAPRATPLMGETILRDYGRTNLPPENDLTLMYRLMENSLLILKSAGNRPLSANQDWASLLRGQNAAHERFLPEGHFTLDAQGRLVDRWGTPLFFHALGSGRYELRSAGPDRRLWTDDDLHRNADGSFRRGAALDSPSLLEASQRKPAP